MRLTHLMFWLEMAVIAAVLAFSVATRGSAARIDHRNVIADHFHKIELNHIYNRHGFSRMDQMIFWDLEGSKYRVQAYVVVSDGRRETEEGLANHNKAVDEYTKGLGALSQQLIRRECRYRGDWEYSRLQPTRLGGRWVAIFHHNGVMRRVTANHYRVTHTLYDPEIENRSKFPTKWRRGFSK